MSSSSPVTTCPDCGSELYEWPPKLQTTDIQIGRTRTLGPQRLVYICENGHTYYGPWG